MVQPDHKERSKKRLSHQLRRNLMRRKVQGRLRGQGGQATRIIEEHHGEIEKVSRK